jgi:hypothetical protein
MHNLFFLLEQELLELKAVHGPKKNIQTRKLESVKEENIYCHQLMELMN